MQFALTISLARLTTLLKQIEKNLVIHSCILPINILTSELFCFLAVKAFY